MTDRLLGALPDRLLLVLLWTCVAVGAATVAGVHRPVVTLPLAAGLVAVTWRWHPPREAPARGDGAASALCLLLVALWVVVQVPYTAERLVVSRDPDVYTLAALDLVDSPDPAIDVVDGSTGSIGFTAERGALSPQGAHVVPALAAVAGWAGGTGAVLAANLVLGGAALVALFALGRRVVGGWWALVPVAGLALSLPMTAFSRALYSEPLAAALTLLGAALLLDAWRAGRAKDLVLAGLALGAVALVRIDGLLVPVGVLAGLTPLALLTGRGADPARRWASPLVAAGAAPVVLLGTGDLLRWSGAYAGDLLGQVAPLGAAAVAAIAASGALAVVASRRAVPTGLAAWTRSAAPALGGVLVGYWLLLASRPLWFESRAHDDNVVVRSLQALEGLTVDGRRRYDELSLLWLDWYWGPVAVVAGLLGLTAWVVLGLRDRHHDRLVLVALVVLPSAVLYLWTAQITPDHVWAVRRYLPAVAPGLLLAATWLVRAAAQAAWRRGGLVRGGGTAVAVGLAGLLVGWPAATQADLWTERDKDGVRDGLGELCRQVAGRPVVVHSREPLLPSIAVVCDVDVLGVERPTRAAFRAAADRLGDDAVLVTRDPDALPAGAPLPPPLDIPWREWEATLLERPDEAVERGTLVIVVPLVDRL